MALALLLCVGLWLQPGPALALNDAQQLVVEAWRLVNQSYVDPTRFETVHWRRLRQKALEQPIETSAQAYDAIAAMLEPIGDPYTRVLRPGDYKALRATTEGSVSGVGLQLSLGEDGQGIVVIAPLDGSPAAEAGISSGSEVLEVEGKPCRILGLEATAARLRGPAGTSVQVLIQPPTTKAGGIVGQEAGQATCAGLLESTSSTVARQTNHALNKVTIFMRGEKYHYIAMFRLVDIKHLGTDNWQANTVGKFIHQNKIPHL